MERGDGESNMFINILKIEIKYFLGLLTFEVNLRAQYH